MKITLLLLFIFCFTSFQTYSANEENPEYLMFLNSSWKMKIDLSGFKIEKDDLDEKKNFLYLMGSNESSGLIVSVFFEKAKGENTSKACKEFYAKKVKNSPFPMSNEKQFSKNGFEYLDYFNDEFQGVKINQQHRHAYYSIDGIWIDIHVSKMSYTEKDAELFNSFFNSVIIENKTSTDFFGIASYYFLKQNFKESIGFYEKTLQSEAKNKMLSKEEWRVVIDNLGMAYGVTGDFTNSKRVLTSGINEDKEYPNFYYTLACVFAEENDLENTLKNLEEAYKVKKNLNKGEIFPNPMEDDSFKRYLTNERFIKLVEKYKD